MPNIIRNNNLKPHDVQAIVYWLMAKYEIKDGVGIIPEGTTAVLPKAFDAWMFSECEKDLKKVSIPDSVTEIGHYAFRNCRNLISVEIPDSVVKRIIDMTFYPSLSKDYADSIQRIMMPVPKGE